MELDDDLDILCYLAGGHRDAEVVRSMLCPHMPHQQVEDILDGGVWLEVKFKLYGPDTKTEVGSAMGLRKVEP